MRLTMGSSWFAVAVATSGLLLAGCATGSQDHPGRVTTPTMRATPSAGRESAFAVTRFDAITLRHPASWRAYRTAGGGDLPDGDGAYLTDAPLDPRCTQTAGTSGRLVHCPADDVPSVPDPGRTWIEVSTVDGPPDPTARDDLDIDGYRAQVDVGTLGPLGYAADSSGLAVPFCAARTDYAEQVTAAAANGSVQPARLVLTACFGARTAAARREFRAMLQTATVVTRPSQTVPVAGAVLCTHDNLRLTYSAQGANESIVATYEFTNVGRVTCRLGGYLRLVLQDGVGTIVGRTVHYRYQGHASALFLLPGAGVTAATQAFLDPDRPIRAHALVEGVYLPGVRGPFAERLDRGGLPILKGGQTVDVLPLTGD